MRIMTSLRISADARDLALVAKRPQDDGFWL